MRPSAWYQLRASRAQPPGRAINDQARAGIYRAALQQAEELLAAARAVGLASRPLPLYYALSQAGRAIVAARGSVVEAPPRHGLRLPTVATRLLETAVEPEPRGQFPAVAEAVESPGLSTAVQLGGLMASIPELAAFPQLGGRWPTALPLWRSDPESFWSQSAASTGFGTTLRVAALVVVFPDPVPASVDELRAALALYPKAAQVDCSSLGGPPQEETRDGAGVVVQWPDHGDGSDPLPPRYGPEDRRWLRPAVCGTDLPPNLLMTWWALLYGLSMLARYHPIEWVRALDLDSSSVAVILDRALDVALEVVPELVLEAIEAADGQSAAT